MGTVCPTLIASVELLIMRSSVTVFVLLVNIFAASGLDKYECTDTTGSVIPLQIVTPGHRIELSTPYYPFKFPNRWLNCVWKIKGLHGTRIEVRLVDMGLNEACNDNILQVEDDSPKGKNSIFKSPGRSRVRLRVTGGLPASCPGKVTSGCPDGPCCKGKDCCLINAGNTPKEIMSPNFPSPSTAGLDCQYKMVTAPGSQIALNFLSLDIRTDSSQACLS